VVVAVHHSVPPQFLAAAINIKIIVTTTIKKIFLHIKNITNLIFII